MTIRWSDVRDNFFPLPCALLIIFLLSQKFSSLFLRSFVNNLPKQLEIAIPRKLGPILFLIFINDIDIACEVTGAHIKKFADDTKCYQIVECEEGRVKFQTMLDNLSQWSNDWQMLFNIDKCHVLHIGKKNPEFMYRWGNGTLETTEEEKDVGIIISKTLKPSLQCAKAAKKANQVLGQLSRGLTYRDKTTL